MNDEVREIEEWLRDISTPTGLSYSGDRTLSNSMVDKIVDYITNLQKENERKERLITQYGEGMCAYANRIDKAIESLKLKQIRYVNESDYVLDDGDLQEEINILQNGSENND